MEDRPIADLKQAYDGGGLHGRQRPGCVRRESGNPRTGFKGIGRYFKPHDVRGWPSSRKWWFPLNCSVRKSPQYAAFKFRGPCQRSAIVRMGTASERYTTNFPNRRRNNGSRDALGFPSSNQSEISWCARHFLHESDSWNSL